MHNVCRLPDNLQICCVHNRWVPAEHLQESEFVPARLVLRRRAELVGCIVAGLYLAAPAVNRHKGETEFSLEQRSFLHRGHSHFPTMDNRLLHFLLVNSLKNVSFILLNKYSWLQSLFFVLFCFTLAWLFLHLLWIFFCPWFCLL